MPKYSNHEDEYSDSDISLSPPTLSAAVKELLSEDSELCMKSQRLRIQECSPRPSPPPRYRSDSNSRLPNIQGSPRVLAAPRIVRVNGPLLRTAPQRFTTPSCGGFDAGEDVPKQSELQSNAEHYVKPPRSPSSLQSIASKVHMADSIETFPDVENKIKKKKQHCTLLINKIPYMRLDCIGKGGSSRVFRVLTGSGKVLALKRVSLKDMGPSTIQGYKGEIDLLRQLSNVDRAVNLIDWELDCQKSTLSLVMEFGDIDFESLLKQQIGGTDARLDTAFIRHYWKEMAHCVEAVHKLNIVHSDLKPANFVLFRGKLKLIDFGIAGLINDHTVNVQRDHQVGTPNYMAPEALLDMNSEAGSLGTADKLIKIGKPSDIWSLGCILYQMVYGRTPFSGIRNHLKRALAIINPDHAIEYPEQGLGGITVPTCFIRSLQSCLHRDQYRRPTIAAILSPANHFFYPNMDTPNEIDLHQDQLGAILKNVVRECERDGLPNEAEVREWTRILFDKLRRVNAGQPSLEPLLPAG